MDDVALMWLELREQGCWAQSRKWLAQSGTFVWCLPLLLLGPYEGGEKVKVNLVQKPCGAQRSHMTSLKLWDPGASAGVSPSLSGQETYKEQSTDPRWIHHMVVTELVSLPHFLFLFHQFPRSLEITSELKPGCLSDGKTDTPLSYTPWSILQHLCWPECTTTGGSGCKEWC